MLCASPSSSLRAASPITAGCTTWPSLRCLCRVLASPWKTSTSEAVDERVPSAFLLTFFSFRYGILVDPVSWIQVGLDLSSWHIMLLWGTLLLHLLAALAVEKLAARRRIPFGATTCLHLVNAAAELLIPCWVIITYHPAPLASFLLLFEVCIIWMKLISYFHVNRHYRLSYLATAQRKKTDSDANPVQTSPTHQFSAEDTESTVCYPRNLTLKDLFYFAAAPTLCYELNFPRTQTIRKRFLFRRVLETCVLLFMIVSLGQQWVVPTVNNTFKEKPTLPFLLRRVLKLAAPNFFIWLMLFYMFFHSFLNATGEILRFGDRQFYRDWWNATTIGWFWRNWNMPVHKWAVRHLYRPLIRHNLSRLQSQLIVFLFSALFHELLVSVPLQRVRMWSFMAMIGQIPLAIFTEKYLKGSQYGNVVMWASLFLGQPAAIMLYVQAYLYE
eukprot:m.79482 g.79482  ORF g.79482 m.79482 type:complete len:442 (+) comp17422_c0_seq1:200-1525(+)